MKEGFPALSIPIEAVFLLRPFGEIALDEKRNYAWHKRNTIGPSSDSPTNAK